MNLLGLHDSSGCAYYRIILPLREMARNGHDVTLVKREDSLKYLRDPAGFDAVIGERMTEYELIPVWRRARKRNNRLVYENDDNIFKITVENWRAYNLFNRDDVQSAVKAFAEWADMVTVTTEPLAEVFREINPAVSILPNCVPECAFGEVTTDRRLRVGWVGGASHGRDIHMATPAVRRFIKRFGDWDLYLGGNDYRPTFKVPVDRVHFEQWHHVVDDEEDYYSHNDFDIGIAPLLDTAFVRCKSAIKCIEYGARGIPVVASDVQPYRDYIEHGVDGFLAKTEHEFLKYLSELAGDEELRLKMGAAARAKAEQHKIESNWTKWEAAYEGMWNR